MLQVSNEIYALFMIQISTNVQAILAIMEGDATIMSIIIPVLA